MFVQSLKYLFSIDSICPFYFYKLYYDSYRSPQTLFFIAFTKRVMDKLLEDVVEFLFCDLGKYLYDASFQLIPGDTVAEAVERRLEESAPASCENWCEDRAPEWSTKCGWTDCNGCPQCPGKCCLLLQIYLKPF